MSGVFSLEKATFMILFGYNGCLSQYCGCWWPGVLSPGHPQPECWPTPYNSSMGFQMFKGWMVHGVLSSNQVRKFSLSLWYLFLLWKWPWTVKGHMLWSDSLDQTQIHDVRIVHISPSELQIWFMDYYAYKHVLKFMSSGFETSTFEKFIPA